MPSFLNLVIEFREREKPHMRTSFFSEVCLGRSRTRQLLPSLGRSGFRVQHCFNLIGVEKHVAAEPEGGSPWRTRQTAAYHSFDVIEGRSIWLFLKGNEIIRERLVTETERYRKAQPGYPESIQGCFLANLRSHMLVFQWSVESWTHYIDHLEQKLARFAAVANSANVTKATGEGPIKQGLTKSGTFNSTMSRQRTGTWSSSSPTLPALSEKLTGLFTTRFGSRRNTSDAGAPAINNDTKSANEPFTDDINLDGEFSFDKLQSLHRQGSNIQQAIGIMSQNSRVLGEIAAHFHKLLDSAKFTTFVDVSTSEYEEEISNFFGRVETIRQSFEGYKTQLRSLHQEVDKNAAMVSLQNFDSNHSMYVSIF